MIECTDLFPDAEWAGAHIHGSDVIRINIQQHQELRLVHMRISKLSEFIDAIQVAQKVYRRVPSPGVEQSPPAPSPPD
jgi:hypothetical protein